MTDTIAVFFGGMTLGFMLCNELRNYFERRNRPHPRAAEADMSLYQCEDCGCCENTALSAYHWRKMKKMPLVCSACDSDPKMLEVYPELGKWHGQFPRTFLPKGMFVTNHEGNLAHKTTGETDFQKYAIKGSGGKG